MTDPVQPDSDREALSDFLFSVYDHGSQPNALREADAILGFLADRRSQQEAPTGDEWEYGVAESNGRMRGQFGGSRDRASVEAWWSEQRDLQGRGCYLVRRSKAGSWLPVDDKGPEVGR